MVRKTCVIMGGHGDIGMAIARRFATFGYNVAVSYFHTYHDSLKESIKKLGVDYYDEQCDITDVVQVKSFIKNVSRIFPSIDCFVCAFGLSLPEKLLIDNSDEEIDRIVAVNLTGVVRCNREILKIFVARRHGVIVNISSIYGQTGGACESVYSACKGGVIALTKALASEVAGLGIRINAVAPGVIETKMTQNILKECRDELCQRVALRRIGTCEDVANVVYFLGSDDAGYMTGQDITVSGGVCGGL